MGVCAALALGQVCPHTSPLAPPPPTPPSLFFSLSLCHFHPPQRLPVRAAREITFRAGARRVSLADSPQGVNCRGGGICFLSPQPRGCGDNVRTIFYHWPRVFCGYAHQPNVELRPRLDMRGSGVDPWQRERRQGPRLFIQVTGPRELSGPRTGFLIIVPDTLHFVGLCAPLNSQFLHQAPLVSWACVPHSPWARCATNTSPPAPPPPTPPSLFFSLSLCHFHPPQRLPVRAAREITFRAGARRPPLADSPQGGNCRGGGICFLSPQPRGCGDHVWRFFFIGRGFSADILISQMSNCGRV